MRPKGKNSSKNSCAKLSTNRAKELEIKSEKNAKKKKQKNCESPNQSSVQDIRFEQKKRKKENCKYQLLYLILSADGQLMRALTFHIQFGIRVFKCLCQAIIRLAMSHFHFFSSLPFGMVDGLSCLVEQIGQIVQMHRCFDAVDAMIFHLLCNSFVE